MKNLMQSVAILIMGALFAVAPVNAAQFKGTVVDVKDGDTLKVRDQNGVSFYVKLSGVDAPELQQLHGHAAREYLLREIAGHDVDIVFNNIDTSGRVLARIYLNGVDVNRSLLRKGLAWHTIDDRNNVAGSDYKEYASAEVKARKAGKGLWNDGMVAVAPWRYRMIVGL